MGQGNEDLQTVRRNVEPSDQIDGETERRTKAKKARKASTGTSQGLGCRNYDPCRRCYPRPKRGIWRNMSICWMMVARVIYLREVAANGPETDDGGARVASAPRPRNTETML